MRTEGAVAETEGRRKEEGGVGEQRFMCEGGWSKGAREEEQMRSEEETRQLGGSKKADK